VYGGQQFNDGQQYGNQQAYEGRSLKPDELYYQQYGNQQAYEGQQFAIQAGYGIWQVRTTRIWKEQKILTRCCTIWGMNSSLQV
jgi:hypothetical protein